MNNIQIIQDGGTFRITNRAGQWWLGPHLPRSAQWEKPADGGSLPCWMTTSKQAALCQAALLEADPAASALERVADELWNESEVWRTTTDDPHGVAMAVYVALRAAALAVSKAIASEPGEA